MGGTVEIIGTNHTTAESITKVRGLIRDRQPDVVALELPPELADGASPGRFGMRSIHDIKQRCLDWRISGSYSMANFGTSRRCLLRLQWHAMWVREWLLSTVRSRSLPIDSLVALRAICSIAVNHSAGKSICIDPNSTMMISML